MSTHVVIMGVSGCGKTTVASAIHQQLGWAYAEGDDLHPASNIEKMSAGIPLTDADRWPWLEKINQWMQEQEQLNHHTVVSCSALKKSYRDVLSKNLKVHFIHLSGSFAEIYEHLAARTDHFMPTSLLESQFATLEPLAAEEPGISINVTQPIATVCAQAISQAETWTAA